MPKFDRLVAAPGPSEKEIFLSLLRECRQDAGLMQRSLADALGRTQGYVSKVESGELRVDILELRRFCAVFGITLAQFSRRLEQRLSGLKATREGKT